MKYQATRNILFMGEIIAKKGDVIEPSIYGKGFEKLWLDNGNIEKLTKKKSAPKQEEQE